jgi:hypothetical protein
MGKVGKGMVARVGLSQTAEIRPAAASSQALCAFLGMFFSSLAAPRIGGYTVATVRACLFGWSFHKCPNAGVAAEVEQAQRMLAWRERRGGRRLIRKR